MAGAALEDVTRLTVILLTSLKGHCIGGQEEIVAIGRESVLQPFCCWFYDPGHAMLEVKQGLRHCKLLWIIIETLGDNKASLGMSSL